ncbi:methyltransferase domain-containing protein [Methylobacterium sp. WL69]|uniref:methyltransferase n=1 Tax=Methylobacterium sp. WL69 TaxID=2603893 RepID=UPI0011C77479|nr:methyltransferase [Methylobacterium sp. WL69]TXM66616.1 methyltransferase domain-containing protein [Methylobacterium sp. WL69]
MATPPVTAAAGVDKLPGDVAPSKDSWRARWRAFRTRTIARPGFQRWAAGFPLTRRIARANTKALFDLCAGFVYSQTLFACVRLDLFRLLADGPLAPEALAARVGLAPDRALRLLKAAAALDLLARLPDGRFALADLGAALIGNPSVSAMIEHHALLYADLADPVALLRGEGPTNLSGYWAYAEAARGDPASAEPVAAYGELMGASQALIAGDILDAYPLRDHRRILDVGGGEGAFLKAAARHAPGLGLMLFDLPAVAARAATRFAEADLSARAKTFGGAFPDDPLPPGADVVTLVRVVHDHDDARVRALLRAAHAALPTGGTLLIAEPMAGTPGAEAMADAYFGFYLLAMGTGRCRTAAELTELLTEAGFGGVREIQTRRPLLTRLLVSTRLDTRECK